MRIVAEDRVWQPKWLDVRLRHLGEVDLSRFHFRWGAERVAPQAISLVAWRRHISASFTGMNFSSAKLGFRSAVRYRGLDHLCVAIFPGPVYICHKPVTIRALELHRFHARSFQTSSHMYG